MEPIPRRDPARFFAAGAVAVLVLLLAAVFYLVSQLATTPLEDHVVDGLSANYRAHRSEFKTIARLASVDATFGIDVASGSFGADDAKSGDVPGYGEILRALHTVGAKHLSASDHELNVTAASEGLAVSGRESGYFYTTSSDVETVTLDVARGPSAPRIWLYPLGNGWYASDYRF